MNIFEFVNNFSEAEISARLGLQEAADGKSHSYVCPVCGHGTHGDGLRFNEKTSRWECYGGCRRSRTTVDLIAAVKKWNPHDKAELAKELERMFPEFASESFSFQREQSAKKCGKVEAVATPRNFEAFYRRCREKYSLKKFVEECGGLWRGLMFETLNAAGAMFNAEYLYDKNKPPVPAIILPYDDGLYYWRRVDKVPEGERKCGVPAGVARKPYFKALKKPLAPELTYFIVESEIDSLSLAQVWGKLNGVIATGSAHLWQLLVAELERQFKDTIYKPSFVIMFDNDAAGFQNAPALESALRAAGFPAVHTFFEKTPKGNYVREYRDGTTEYFTVEKVDANDILQQGDLFMRIIKTYDPCKRHLWRVEDDMEVIGAWKDKLKEIAQEELARRQNISGSSS